MSEKLITNINLLNRGTDRYDDEKSKSIFEMFCTDRSNNVEDDEEDNSYGGLSMTYGNEQQEGSNEFGIYVALLC